MANKRWMTAAGLSLMLLLGGCGGGGGDDVMESRSVDELPAGERIDVSAHNYFPSRIGDQWVYDRRSAATGLLDGSVTRLVSAASVGNDHYLVTETDHFDPTLSDVTEYAPDPGGAQIIDPMGGPEAPREFAAISQALPTLVEYPTPILPVGGERRVLRQGPLGDMNEDGKTDSYRIEMVQVFKGFESIVLRGRTLTTLHFRTRLAMTLRVTGHGDFEMTATQDEYFADGIGLVRADRSETNNQGEPVTPAYSIELQRAAVGGEEFVMGQPVLP